MTAKQLIETLQKLGEENLNRDVIMFDGPSWFTPYKAEVITDDKLGEQVVGKIIID